MNADAVERIYEAIRNFPTDAETTINGVFHGEGSEMLQESITLLMPVSDKKKGTHAKYSQSLRSTTGNLFVIIRAKKNRQYLYFPDDGTNTYRHVGNQQFFRRGAEAVQDEIIDMTVGRLVQRFEEL